VTRPASTAAAIATAACLVLVDHVPDRASSVEARYDAYLAAIPDGPVKDNGIAAGRQVGDAIVAWRTATASTRILTGTSLERPRASSSPTRREPSPSTSGWHTLRR
jgi:hypothetical protein